MTPRELALQLDGYRWRDQRAWERTAWAVAYLLQPWAKEGHTIQPKDLLTSAETKEVDALLDPGAASAAAIDEFAKAQAERKKAG